MRIRQSYEELLTVELDEIKALAAVATRYLEKAKVEDLCDEALAYIRPAIKSSQGEIRRLRKIIARHEGILKRHGVEIDSYWVGALERAEKRLALEQRHRDEIKEGLAMSRKMRREETAELTKLYRELRAEKPQA